MRRHLNGCGCLRLRFVRQKRARKDSGKSADSKPKKQGAAASVSCSAPRASSVPVPPPAPARCDRAPPVEIEPWCCASLPASEPKAAPKASPKKAAQQSPKKAKAEPKRSPKKAARSSPRKPVAAPATVVDETSDEEVRSSVMCGLWPVWHLAHALVCLLPPPTSFVLVSRAVLSGVAPSRQFNGSCVSSANRMMQRPLSRCWTTTRAGAGAGMTTTTTTKPLRLHCWKKMTTSP